MAMLATERVRGGPSNTTLRGDYGAIKRSEGATRPNWIGLHGMAGLLPQGCVGMMCLVSDRRNGRRREGKHDALLGWERGLTAVVAPIYCCISSKSPTICNN